MIVPVTKPETIEDFVRLFATHGGTDEAYLRVHFARFVETKRRFVSHWDRARGNKVLDVGAHWLHQAMLYATDGFEVTALDLPITIDTDRARQLARDYPITLLPNADLEHPTALADFADSTFDIVLFTEVIEHITFNPVAMWREIYRVLKPGGRIVVTTPNYYALRGRAWRWLRFARGMGGGVAVSDIVSRHSNTQHWKEYSLRELIQYFTLLSPDFACHDATHVEAYPKKRQNKRGSSIVLSVEHVIPILRPDVYLEVELPRKEKGIVIEPNW